jgi:hypothetical protein
MQRRSILAIAAVTALGFAILSSGAIAQQNQQAQQSQPKTIKSQIVGAWNLLLVDQVKDDGTHVPLYGPNPVGIIIFTPDGHYSSQIMRVNRPKFASNNTQTASGDDAKAVVAGMISHFGTYTVDEAAKTFTVHIEGSSFPNWDGTKQTRNITAITDEVLTYDSKTSTRQYGPGDHTELAWKKYK